MPPGPPYSHWTVLAVTLAVVLAGCSLPVDLGDSEPTSSSTGPDGDVASPTPDTDRSGALLPGITESGITNLTAVRATNREAVLAEGFEARYTATGRADGGNLTVRMHTVQTVGANGTPYHLNRSQIGGLSRDYVKSAWANASVLLSRSIRLGGVAGDRQTAYRRTDGDVKPPDVVPARQFLVFAAVGNYTVERNDSAIVLTADSVRPPGEGSERAEFENVTAYDARLVFDEAGRIRSGDVNISVRSRDRTLTYEVRYRLVRTGVTAVDRPDWVPTALAEAPRIDLSATVVDGKFVRLTHEGGDTVSAGLYVGLSQNGSGGLAKLSEQFEPSDTIWLWHRGSTVKLARQRPNDVDPTPLSGQYDVEIRSIEGPGGPLVERSIEANTTGS